MIQLVYRSRADPLLTDAQIEDILVVSRRNNARDGITGVLLYQAGQVVQVLEGEQEKVLRLFDTLRQDRRHREVSLVYTRPLSAREFGDWSMGFRPVDTTFWTMPAGSSDIRRLITAVALLPDSPARSTLLEFGNSVG